MQILNFISSESLIASIQEDLSAYDANNQLDPGRWHPWIKKVATDLGLEAFEYKHALVFIKDYHGPLECDFQVLDSAFWVTDKCCGGLFPPQGILQFQGKSIIWDDTTTSCAEQVPDCPAGESGCDFRTCSLEKFNEVTVREYVQGLPYTYYVSIGAPLAVNQRVAKGWCLPHSICFGSTSKQEITIANGEVFTNFQEGIVLLNYYTYPVDERGVPKIPDNPKYKLAIEHYLKWKILENLWVNNDDMAVEKKMLYFKNEFQTNSYPDAEYYAKLTSFDAVIDIARNNRTRFNWAQLIQK